MKAIGKIASKRIDEERGDGARQQHQSCFKRRSAPYVLDEQRHDERDAHEARIEEVRCPKSHYELLRREYIHVDERIVDALLSPDEGNERNNANKDRHPDR